MTSGLVLLPNVTWLSFHSGYDFGYLIKLLTSTNLPAQVCARLRSVGGRRWQLCPGEGRVCSLCLFLW